MNEASTSLCDLHFPLDCFGLFTSPFCMLDLIGIGSESERHRLSVADGSPGYVSARIGHHVASSKRLF